MNKYDVGTVHPTNNSGDIEIIECLSNKIRKVKFLDTNSIKETTMSSIHSGTVKDPSLPDKYDVGAVHPTNNSGDIEIIKCLPEQRRLIKFLGTNTIKNVNVSAICGGKIKDRSVLDTYPVGAIHSTNNYGDIEIIKYLSNRRRLVRFLDSGYEKVVIIRNIFSGEIKDTSIATVCNVGIIGTVDLTGKPLYKEAHKRWSNIISRCYSTNSKSYNEYGAKGITVSEDWKYFPNFYSWFVENYIEHCEIDKDLKQCGVKNKVYSADTCVFLPSRLNNSIKIGKGYCKIGNRYQSICFGKKGNICTGLFDTKEEALASYLKTKIATIQKIMYNYGLTVDTIKAVNTFIDKIRHI